MSFPAEIRPKILKVVDWILRVWGGLSLIGAIIIAAFFAYKLGPGNRDQEDSASVTDVRFVLNWCQLGDGRIEKVLHSHVSSQGFNGDHLDAYAIKISHVDLAELTTKKEESPGTWYRGDQLPKVLDDAVGFAALYVERLPWFPSEKELRSSEFYVYPGSIWCHGIRPDAAELIFIRPSDKMVFYFGGKM